jgi:Bacterial Ig-like domain
MRPSSRNFFNTSLAFHPSSLSEAMDPSTVTVLSVTVLKADTTTPITAKVSYDAASKTLTLVPSVILAKRTKYMISIEGGDTDGLAVQDVAGNELAADKVWSFTTGLK